MRGVLTAGSIDRDLGRADPGIIRIRGKTIQTRCAIGFRTTGRANAARRRALITLAVAVQAITVIRAGRANVARRRAFTRGVGANGPGGGIARPTLTAIAARCDEGDTLAWAGAAAGAVFEVASP